MGGPDVPKIKLDTVSKCFQNLVDKQPDQELFVFYKGEVRKAYTSRQLFQLAGKFAHRLRHQYGLSQGDVVANTLPNSPERLITDLGVTLAGCIGLNGQILLSDGDDFFLNARRSRAQAVVVNPKETSPAWRLIKPYVVDVNSQHTVSLSCDRAPDLTTAILVTRDSSGGCQPFMKDTESSREEIFLESFVAPKDTLYVFTTSGSTGYSKLVPRTQGEYSVRMDQMVKEDDDPQNPVCTYYQGVMYNDRPLGWVVGYPVATYISGVKRVMLDAFDMTGLRRGEDMWRAITQEGCTAAFILPLDLDHVVTYVKQLDDNRYKLKRMICGGQPLTRSQMLKTEVISEEVIAVYGSTEAGPATHDIVTADNYRDFSAGKSFTQTALKIVDENSYQECAPGQVGIILAKGRLIFSGYYNRLEDPDPNTAKVFTKDGWFITEDLGYFDTDGNLFVLGRNKDVIMYGAAVVYPGWLEARIVKHPDILECCVVPVSDPVLFHNICACVKPREGISLNGDRMRKICEQLFILETEAESVPMPKCFLILNDLPETDSGKPDKKKMTAMAEEKFGYKEI